MNHHQYAKELNQQIANRDAELEQLRAENAELKKAQGEPVAWRNLTDAEWINVVNHDRSFHGFSKDEAVATAVKMTEEKLKELNAAPQPAAAIDKPPEYCQKQADCEQTAAGIDERAEFEREWLEEIGGCECEERSPNKMNFHAGTNSYTHLHTQDAWCLWRARAKLNAQPAPTAPELAAAAAAVVDRWDSTDWKAAPTADYIARLRNALSSHLGRPK